MCGDAREVLVVPWGGSSALADVLLAVLVRGFALQDVAVGWGLLSHQLAPCPQYSAGTMRIPAHGGLAV